MSGLLKRVTGFVSCSLIFLVFNVSAEIPIYNTGLVGYWPSVSGKIITFMVDEWYMNQDFNNDGEARNNIVIYFDTETGTYTSTNQIGYDTSIDGNLIAYFYEPTRELAYFDIDTHTNYLLGINADWPTISEGRIAFDDRMNIAYYDIESSTAVYTDAYGYWSRIKGDIIAFETGSLIGYYNISTGETLNTGISGHQPVISGSLIAFYSYEHEVNEDLNGDGEINSYVPVIRYYNIATGTTVNTGIAGFPAIDGSIIAYSYRERDVNQDIDGDGTISSKSYIGYYDIAKAQATETGAVGRFNWNGTISGNLIAFETYEAWVNEDLNGNGDINYAEVVRYLFIPPTPSIPVLESSIENYLNDGSISNVAIANAISAFVKQAQAMLEKEQAKAAVNILQAFQKRILAQNGKSINEDAGNDLIDIAQAIIDSL